MGMLFFINLLMLKMGNQALAYEARNHMRTPMCMPKTLEMCQKKTCLVWLKKLQGVTQIAHLRQQCFLSATFYKIQRPYKKIMCICYFIRSVVKIVLYLHFFYTKDDWFQQIKKKHEWIVFLTSLLIILSWKI